MDLVTSWLTFAVMVLIQAVMAASIISAIKTTLNAHSAEIERLRDWKHEFGPRQMVYDGWGKVLEDYEDRIRDLEKRK